MHDFYKFIKGGVNKIKWQSKTWPDYQAPLSEIHTNFKSKMRLKLVIKLPCVLFPRTLIKGEISKFQELAVLFDAKHI